MARGQGTSIMTITLTSISKNQWQKVLKVALWVVLSNGAALGLAWLLKQPYLLAAGPAINIVGSMIVQVFQQEEGNAIADLPANIQPEVQQAADAAAAKVGTIITPTQPQTPATAPTNAPNPPAIGSNANS